MKTLRDYQKNTVENAFSMTKEGRVRLCIQSPTGSGKSVMIAHLVKRLDSRCLIITHRQELITQIANELIDVGIHKADIGSHETLTKKIVVGMVQTLCRRNHPQFEVVIIDEAHHALAVSYQKILKRQSNAHLFLFTATPYRADGKGLGRICDKIYTSASINDLINEGALVPTKCYSHPESVDISNVKIVRGDFDQRELASRCNRPKLVGDIVSHWQDRATGLPTLCYCVDISHSKAVAEQFRQAGIRAIHIDGATEENVRTKTRSALESGEWQVVTNCMVFTEGFDCPAIKCVVLARPTASDSLFRQMVGRCMRPFGKSTYGLVLDHAGNIKRFGLPEHDPEFSLEDKKKTKKGPPVKTCPSCGKESHLSQIRCECGFEFPSASRKSKLTIHEGQLIRYVTAKSGSLPYGFKWKHGKKKNDPCVAVPNKEEIQNILLMQKLRADGLSLADICRVLTNQGIRPRSGGKWFPKVIMYILNRSTNEAA